MPVSPPTIYVIAGCNGAGKTTFAREYLPWEVRCLNFLNADLIAQGLSPFDTQAAALPAGRLLLAGFRKFVATRMTFALESTLSGHTYIRLLKTARSQGYRVFLHYLWLPSPAIAMARIQQRVKKGGHGIPEADVRRRFPRSLRHFVHDYAPLADRWAVWDNQASPATLLAESSTCSLASLERIMLPS
jgi:predicted ABC-type ATPase